MSVDKQVRAELIRIYRELSTENKHFNLICPIGFIGFGPCQTSPLPAMLISTWRDKASSLTLPSFSHAECHHVRQRCAEVRHGHLSNLVI
jgi:hypothetical protein